MLLWLLWDDTTGGSSRKGKIFRCHFLNNSLLLLNTQIELDRMGEGINRTDRAQKRRGEGHRSFLF